MLGDNHRATRCQSRLKLLPGSSKSVAESIVRSRCGGQYRQYTNSHTDISEYSILLAIIERLFHFVRAEVFDDVVERSEFGELAELWVFVCGYAGSSYALFFKPLSSGFDKLLVASVPGAESAIEEMRVLKELCVGKIGKVVLGERIAILTLSPVEERPEPRVCPQPCLSCR